MTVNKRKKSNRYRASMTHGKGSKKKRRGSGNKGGKGMAGTGKRSDNKKPSIWKDVNYFGKHGFVSKCNKDVRAVNIGHIEENIDKLISQGLISKDGGFFLVELEKLGFNKLLSDGPITNKFKIKAAYASKKAVDKIKESGGGNIFWGICFL